MEREGGGERKGEWGVRGGGVEREREIEGDGERESGEKGID